MGHTNLIPCQDISLKSILNLGINGYNSAIFGDKLIDDDFVSEIENCDIVSLLETHATGKSLSLPGFHEPFRSDRPLTKKLNKSFGGVAVFVRESLIKSKLVHLLKKNKI